jgi:hypothetical protein
MTQEHLATVAALTDDALRSNTLRLATSARHATAELVAHLAEVETRDLHLKDGYPSLFVYCRRGLRLSEAETYNRMAASRAARRFPLILQLLTDGIVNLTTVRILAPHLTDDNHREVLESGRDKTRREVEAMAAVLCPKALVPTTIRPVPVRRASAPAFEMKPPTAAPVPAAAAPTPSASPAPHVAPLLPPPRPATTTPLTAEHYKLQVTITAATVEKMDLARDLMRHAHPGGDDAALLERALDALLEELLRRKFGTTESTRAGRATGPDSRHVPAAVRREVYVRDGGRCAYVSPTGRRCGERGFVEFHHVRPWSAGGLTTTGNIQLRCRAHNAYESKLHFAASSSRNEVALPPG